MASEKSKARKTDSKEKSTVHKKSTKKTPPPPAVYKSEEFVQESDSDEEQEKEDSLDEDSESDDETSSAKPTKATSKANGKLPAPAGSSSSSEAQSEDGEEDSEKSSDDEEDSEEVTNKAPVAVEPTKRPAKEPTVRTVSFKAPAPFQPPRGFDIASIDETSKSSQLLKKSNLEGKQIWYFTAPASVPITSIRAMSMSDARKGKAVLTHQGNDYGFTKDSTEDKTYTKIMVPSSSDDGYKYTSKSIDQVFHLQQIVRNPTTANPSKATIPAAKSVRQQPRGLKMRFRPIGFGSGETGRLGSTSPSASDLEMEHGSSLSIRRVASKSKDADKSDSDPSGSDAEMEDHPPVSSKPHVKTKNGRPSSSGTSEKEPSLKRKHSDGGEKKSKHSSSSIISSIDNRELKRLKKKQKESQRNTAGSLSASTEHQTASAPKFQPKAPTKSLISTTPIPPPKLLTSSQPSVASASSQHTKPHKKIKSA